MPQGIFGLFDVLAGRVGISAYAPRHSGPFSQDAQKVRFYSKNGILVGHTGHTITPDAVAKALDED